MHSKRRRKTCNVCLTLFSSTHLSREFWVPTYKLLVSFRYCMVIGEEGSGPQTSIMQVSREPGSTDIFLIVPSFVAMYSTATLLWAFVGVTSTAKWVNLSKKEHCQIVCSDAFVCAIEKKKDKKCCLPLESCSMKRFRTDRLNSFVHELILLVDGWSRRVANSILWPTLLAVLYAFALPRSSRIVLVFERTVESCLDGWHVESADGWACYRVAVYTIQNDHIVTYSFIDVFVQFYWF